MPTLETPPNPAPTTTPTPPTEPVSGKVRVGRFGELDHTELVHLLDSLDDERSKARFRESIYISLFFWLAVVAFLIFAPRVFPHAPQFVFDVGQKDAKVTNLTVPPEVQKAINHAPRSKPFPKRSSEGKSIEQPRQSAPQAPTQQQQPAQQPSRSQVTPAPQAAAPPPPPPVVQQSPLPQPQPQQNVAALPSAPAPSTTPTKPNFGSTSSSARDMVQEAGRAAARGTTGMSSSGGGGQLERHGLGDGVEVLSDMQGVNFDAYIAKIKREIEETWWPLIPEEARPPLNKQGETQIRFVILPDGRIGGMLLEGSSHDDAINKSCWGSITGVGQFPPLPKEFHGPNLDLRFHYFVNKEPR